MALLVVTETFHHFINLGFIKTSCLLKKLYIMYLFPFSFNIIKNVKNEAKINAFMKVNLYQVKKKIQ